MGQEVCCRRGARTGRQGTRWGGAQQCLPVPRHHGGLPGSRAGGSGTGDTGCTGDELDNRDIQPPGGCAADGRGARRAPAAAAPPAHGERRARGGRRGMAQHLDLRLPATRSAGRRRYLRRHGGCGPSGQRRQSDAECVLLAVPRRSAQGARDTAAERCDAGGRRRAAAGRAQPARSRDGRGAPAGRGRGERAGNNRHARPDACVYAVTAPPVRHDIHGGDSGRLDRTAPAFSVEFPHRAAAPHRKHTAGRWRAARTALWCVRNQVQRADRPRHGRAEPRMDTRTNRNTDLHLVQRFRSHFLPQSGDTAIHRL